MATPMARDQFENLTNLEVALRAVYFDQMEAVADPNAEILGLFNQSDSERAAERSQGMGGFSNFEEYTGTLEYDSFELLYRKAYEHVEYAKGMAVERKLVDDDEYNVISRRAELLGIAANRTIYNHAASVFNNAFTSATAQSTGGDAVSLCNASHPLSPTDSSTQSNTGTTALSHAAVVSTEQLMMAYTDSRGNPMNVMPDTIVVPTGLKATALTIANSYQVPDSANNDINTVQGMYQVVVSRYLTDANNWFLVDSKLARVFLNWYWRVRPEFVADPTSDYNLNARFRGYMRYSFGFDHWAWIYGHNVT